MSRPSLDWIKAWEAPGFDSDPSPTPLSNWCRFRIALLVAVHLALGLGMACVALAWPGFDKPFWVSLPMIGLVCSEALLLGMWLGLSRTPWWLKLIGFVSGMSWLTFLAFAPVLREARFTQIDDTGGPILAVVFAVALASLCHRSFVAQLVHRDQWPQRPLADEMQFTLKSIIALTFAVAALLGLRSLVRLAFQWRSDDEIILLVLGFIAVLAWTLLLWSCLGQGSTSVRIPVMLVAMAALGLIFPYYTGGPSWGYATWPALMVTIAGYAAGSLVVVRACGYRLVSVW
jgi:hypothetical protein